RPLEDPILPGREAREDLALERLRPAEPERGFHAGQRVRREGRALFDREPYFVIPVDVVGREGDKSSVGRLLCSEILADSPLEIVRTSGLAEEATRESRQPVDHRVRTEIHS